MLLVCRQSSVVRSGFRNLILRRALPRGRGIARIPDRVCSFRTRSPSHKVYATLYRRIHPWSPRLVVRLPPFSYEVRRLEKPDAAAGDAGHPRAGRDLCSPAQGRSFFSLSLSLEADYSFSLPVDQQSSTATATHDSLFY